MPVAAPLTLIERRRSILENMRYDEEGNVELEPSQYYKDWVWNNKGLFGDPAGWLVGLPPVHDSHNWFLSQKAEADRPPNPATMTCQNTQPVGLDKPQFTFNQAWIANFSPPSAAIGEKSGLAAPDAAPIITYENPSVFGFAAGEWMLVAYYKNALGEISALSDPEYVTLVQGGWIKITFKLHIEEGATKMGIMFGPSALSYAGLQVQREWNLSQLPRNYDLTGPYHAVVKPPSGNKTKKGKHKRPRVRRKHHHHKLKKGKYKIGTTGHTIGGEAAVSEEVEVEVLADEDSVALEIEPDGEYPDSTGTSIYVEIDGEQYIIEESEGSATIQSEKTQSNAQPVTLNGDELKSAGGEGEGGGGGTNTSKLYANTGNRQRQRKRSGGGRSKGVPPEDDTETTDPEVATEKSKKSKKLKKKKKPVEDNTGLSAPSGVFESIAVQPSQNPLPPGTYLCGYTRAAGENQTVLSPTATIVIPDAGSGVAAKTATATIPHPLNEIINANFAQRNSSGQPLWHTNTPALGIIGITSDGKLQLNTNGAQTVANSPKHASNLFTVDKSADYYMAAAIQVASWGAGTFEVVLRQYSDTAGTVQIGTGTRLKVISTNGDVQYQAKYGPNGVAWASNVVTAKIEHLMTGTPDASGIGTGAGNNQMQARVYNWYVRKFSGGARRVTREGVTYRTDPDNSVPFPSTAIKIIGPPPTAIASAPPGQPLWKDFLTFDAGTLTNGYTAQNTAGAHIVGQVSASAALNGANGYRFARTQQLAGGSAIYKNYSEVQNTFSERMLLKVVARPTFGFAYYEYAVSVMSFGATVGMAAPSYTRSSVGEMARVYIGSNGGVYLQGIWPVDGAGYWSIQAPVSVVNGDILDIEMIARNTDSLNGELILLFGKNGQQRTQVTKLTNLNWLNYNVHQVVAGPHVAQHDALTYDFYMDDLIVADNGAPLSLAPSLPELEPYPTPDRPLLSGDLQLPADEFSPTGPQQSSPSIAAGVTVTYPSTTPMSSGGNYMKIVDPGTSGQTNTVQATYSEQNSIPNGTFADSFELRVDALPSSGEVSTQVMRSSSDVASADVLRIVLDSSGNLWADPLYTGTARRKLAKGVVAGRSYMIEVMLRGLGTATGALDIYVRRTDITSPREYLVRLTDLNWSALSAADYVAILGLLRKSSTTITCSVSFDHITISELGEFYYEEYSADGRFIEECYLLLLPGQPTMPGLYLHGGREAVVPGDLYTASIRHRHSGVPLTEEAEPYWIVGYDTRGNKHSLVCLCEDEVAGTTGINGDSGGWVTLTKTDIEIPEGIYAIEWESRNMVTGEYMCQAPYFGKDPTANREVTYALSGFVHTILDTYTPRINHRLAPLNSKWRKFSSLVEHAPSCTDTEVFYSSTTPNSGFTPEQANPDDVIESRYAHHILNVAGNGSESSVLRWGSPRLEYDIDVTDTLLTEDEQELPGGVVLGNVQEWSAREHTDVIDLDTGKILRRSSGNFVGRMPGVDIQCFTLAAKRWLEEMWSNEDTLWIIQTTTEKVLVKATGELEFKELWGSHEVEDGTNYVFAWYEATSDRFEVVETSPLIPAWGKL